MIKLPQFLLTRLPQGAFSRNVFILAGSAALGQALVMLASPILTRIYSISDFGHLQAYLSVLLLVVPVASARYDLAIVLPKADEAAADLTVLCLSITAVVSAATGAVVWWLSSHHPVALVTDLKGSWWLLPVSVLGAGCYASLAQWTLRHKNYALVGRSKISQGLGQVTTQLALGVLFPPALFGLLCGDAVGRISGTWSFVRTAWRLHRHLFATNWARLKSVAVKYRRFPLVSSLSAVINGLGSSAPQLLIADWYSVQTLGLYAMTDRMLGVPTILIGTAVSQVYTVDAARLAHSTPGELRSLCLRTMRRLALLGAVPFLVLCLFGEPLFGFVFGPGWREAGHYARWLALTQYVAFIVWPIMPTLNLLERQSWQFGWDLGRMILTLGAIALAHVLGWSASSAIAAYAVVMLVCYAFHPVLSFIAISRHVHRPSDHSPPAPFPAFPDGKPT